DERMISAVLQHGDWIGCGQTRLQFIRPDADNPDEKLLTESSQSDNPEQKTAELGVVVGQREDLRKLLAINKELNREHELRPLLERIIDTAIELMAAERGFLILVDH